jgi:long-chain fatty acid transport protein
MISKIGAFLSLLSLLGLAALPAHGAGFAFFDQGGKASGMAGAFTAQASDPSAIVYNPGGLGLLKKKKSVTAGTAVSTFNESLYQGLSPGIGAGTTGQQQTALGVPAHAYVTLPVGKRMVAGVGVYSPFRMHTEWADPGSFAARYDATSSRIEAWDVAPTLGIRLAKGLGLGVGVIYRTSEIAVSRRIAGLSPVAASGAADTANIADTAVPIDVASLDMKTDMEPGYGFTAGILGTGAHLSWGFSYRSAIKTDYVGVGRLSQVETGDPQYDELVRATMPLNQDLALSSSLEYPDQASLGVAWNLTKSLTLAADVSRTGWASVKEVALLFPASSFLDTRYPLNFQDAMAYRLGASYRLHTGPQLRAGFAFEETPQPDASVGAFLPDSNRGTLALGVGLDWLDVAFAWTTYDQRIVSTSAEGLNGNYRANAWSFVVSATK